MVVMNSAGMSRAGISLRAGLLLGSALVLTYLRPLPAWSQSTFGILGQPVLTLHPTESQTSEARLGVVEQRLQGILSRASTPDLVVEVEGDETQAQIRLNNELLIEVLPVDAEANSTTQVDAIARLWGQQLQGLFNQAAVQRSLFRAAGLPETLTWGGQTYRLADDAIPDLGRFVTDGTRVADQVIYWEISAQDLGSLSHSGVPPSPESAPPEVFVLNRYREFLVYRSQ